MKFAAGFLAYFAASASATKIFEPSGDVPLDSPLGRKLMAKATVVEPARHLNNNNEQYSFLYKYSIKYLSCSSLVQVSGEGNDEQGILYTQQLVKFALCPADSCGSCSGGGEYVVNMYDFVNAYTEARLTAEEQACETVRENCNCQYANDDSACEASCYYQAGLDSCIQYDGQDDFEIQRYLECGGKFCCVIVMSWHTHEAHAPLVAGPQNSRTRTATITTTITTTDSTTTRTATITTDTTGSTTLVLIARPRMASPS